MQGDAQGLAAFRVQRNDDWPFITAYKTADESRNNTTVLTEDAELKVTLKANRTYRFRMVFWVVCTSATPDVKIMPYANVLLTNALGWVYRADHQVDLADVNSNMWAGSPLLMNGYNISMPSGSAMTNGMPVVVEGTAEVGSSDTVLSLYWAQNTSNAADVTVKRGSCLIAEELG